MGKEEGKEIKGEKGDWRERRMRRRATQREPHGKTSRRLEKQRGKDTERNTKKRKTDKAKYGENNERGTTENRGGKDR